MLKSCLIAFATAAMASSASAQSSEPLPDYRPLLPQVQARAYPIDRAKGYVVKALKPGVFLVTDGVYQVMFAPTGKGVVLFDAPGSLAPHLVGAVAEVTPEPIKILVYSHAHVDHIGGAGTLLRQLPGLQIVAEQGVADFLREVRDPDRPIPTRTFRRHETLTLGSLKADLQVGHWHSATGDLMIELPQARVLMAVDVFSPGSVPFMGLDLTQDMHEYLKVFDQILARDWDVLVGGHLNNPATRDDVRQMKAYVDDVYVTAARLDQAGDPGLFTRAVGKYGPENLYAAGGVVIDQEIDQCARELVSRWSGQLNNVDVEAPSQCRTALIYAHWDVGAHGRAASTGSKN
jgi:glyoxylase-like metal-dependent hydrolase (beta-lactamase superfamily II)